MKDGSVVSCFDQHRGHVLSVCWGAEDKDMVFTGGEDKFCYLWKYTDYPYTLQKSKYYFVHHKAMSLSSTIEPTATRIRELQVIEATDEPSTTKRQETLPTPEAKKRKTKESKLTDLMSVTKRSSNVVGQPQLLRHCVQLAARLYGGNVDEAVATVRNRIPSEVNPSEYEYISFAQSNQVVDDDDKILGLFFGDKFAILELIGIEGNMK